MRIIEKRHKMPIKRKQKMKKIIMLVFVVLSVFKGVSMESGNEKVVGNNDINLTSSKGYCIGYSLLDYEPIRLPSPFLQLTSNNLSLNAVQAKINETKKNNPPEKGVFESPTDRRSPLTSNDQSFNAVQRKFNETKENDSREGVFGHVWPSGEDENSDDLKAIVIDVPLCSFDDILTSERTPSALSVREKDLKFSPTEGAVDSIDLSSDSGEENTNSQEIVLDGVIWKVEEVSSRIWS